MDVLVSTKNQVVIPKDIRRKLGIKPGDRVRIEVQNGKVNLAKTPSIREQLDSIMRSSKPKKTNAVTRIRKLREEWDV